MQIPNSLLVMLALSMAVVPAASALDCKKEADHKKEYISDNKVYKLYCNSLIQPINPSELIKDVSSPEACADQCAKKPSCGHSYYAQKNKNCFLRPKPTSIKEKGIASKVDTLGNTWAWVYDRAAPVPEVPEPGNGGNGESGNEDGNGDNSGENATGENGDGKGDGKGDGTGDGKGGVKPPTSWAGNQGSYDCTGNKDHGKLFSANGRTFELLCGHANPSTGYHTEPNVNSLKACVELCALDSKCGNAEYHANGNCELEPDNNPIAHEGYHLWVPKSCPSTPRATSASPNPPQTKDLTCPMSDGHIYEGVDGTWYYIQCCSDSDGAVVTGFDQAKDHKDCLDKCSADKKCSSVSFDTKAADNCKFYGPGKFSTLHKPGLHHHFATNPPTVEPDLLAPKRCSTECPEADGQIFASPTGENFVMSCKKRHGTTYLKATPDRYSSFASCMKACGALPACLSVDYEVKTQKCFFSTNAKPATIEAGAFMSAHSAGCSGACAGCEENSCKDLDKGPMPPTKYGCPSNHGKPITVKGVDFQVACQHAINSHPWNLIPASDYEECLEKCATASGCGGANWIDSKCYHHPDNNSDGSSAFVHSRADSDAYVKIPGHLYNSLVNAS